MYVSPVYLYLGALSVVTALDRETQDKYMLTVAADDGVQSSTATVVVMVTDVNDESPEFLEQEYYFDIPENTDTGKGLVTLIRLRWQKLWLSVQIIASCRKCQCN